MRTIQRQLSVTAPRASRKLLVNSLVLVAVALCFQTQGAKKPQNQPPRIQLAAQSEIGLGCGNMPATVQIPATVVDDGLPKGKKLTYRWSITSASGAANAADFTLLNASQRVCSLTAKTDGLCKLRLTVSDGEKESSAETSVVTYYSPATIDIGADIQGTINYRNQGVSGALVKALRKGLVVATTYSDSSGHYSFSRLPGSFSKYSIQASLNGRTGDNKECALLLPCRSYRYGAAGCNVNLR
ncbi:MAG: hypothetical protein U1G07_09600 [Verrucomicrobiota bacterium]